MRDKHLHIPEDSSLQKQINKEIGEYRPGRGKTILFLSVKFIFYFSLASLSYSYIYSTTSILAFILCYVSFGILLILLGFNFAHDFSHNTIFSSKTLNEFFFIFLYTLLGAHAEAWKHRHIHSHHYAPNVKDYDSDLQITNMIRVEPETDRQWYHQFQHLYAPFLYTTYSLYWIFIKDFVIYFGGDLGLEKNKFSFHFSFWLQKLFYLTYILILPILFSNHSWITVLAGFVAMHLIQSLFLLFTFFITHHVESTSYFSTDDKGYIDTSWFMNQIRSSNDFYPFSKTANFIFGGFNNHIAHHLFPHINSIYYPEINKILFRILKDNGIAINVSTYMGGVVSHLRHLRNMGKL